MRFPSTSAHRIFESPGRQWATFQVAWSRRQAHSHMPASYGTNDAQHRKDGMKAIHLESRGPVALILIDRPERRNAMDAATAEALAAALDELDSNDEFVAGVLAGVGP